MLASVSGSVLHSILNSVQTPSGVRVLNIGAGFTKREGVYTFLVSGKASRVPYIQGLLKEAGYIIISDSEEWSRNEHRFYIKEAA
jgi:hypothetical protein